MNTNDEIVHIAIGKKFLNSLINNMERMLRMTVDDVDSDISVERPELYSHNIIEIEEQIDILKTKMDEIISRDEENAMAYQYVPKFIITDEYETDEASAVSDAAITSQADADEEINDFENYDNAYQGRGLTMEDLLIPPLRPITPTPFTPFDMENTLKIQETNDWNWNQYDYGAKMDLCGNFIRAVDVGHIHRSKANQCDEIDGELPVRSYTINNEMEGNRWNPLYDDTKDAYNNYRPLTYFEMEDYKMRKYNMV